MRRNILLNLIEVISHILIFFFVKYQLSQFNIPWYILGTMGVLIYLMAFRSTESIIDKDQKNFVRGILITIANVCFFVAFGNLFTIEVMQKYSYYVAGIGIIIYFFREEITNIIL